MVAYADLVSLTNLMEHIQNHPRHSFSFDKKQMDSLLENVNFLLDYIESCGYHGASKTSYNLERRISSSAQAAEDIIESQVVDQILAGSTIHGCKEPIKSIRKKVKEIFAGYVWQPPSFLLDLQKTIKDMDSIKKKILEMKDKSGFKDQQLKYSIPAASSKPLSKTSMVGFDEYLIQVLDLLTGQQSHQQTISIAGMGGIGKTTLARNVFENPFIIHHFDFRAWATISQEYDVSEVLLQLLSCIEKSSSGTVDELGEQLYKKLSGSRYLIVLDDMWSTEVWDEIKFFLPNNLSRSRITITTRLSNLPCHSYFAMDFLDEDNIWELFCEKAFGEDVECPLELVRVGKKIVEQCEGLPLSIVVIGGHLRKSSRTKEYWEYIASNINSILTLGDEQCLDILNLSYDHLPPHLKPCFIYMGIFPEQREISASKLIKLWVAEGFLKSNKTQSFEETAECYLEDLVDRNLILVRQWSPNGKIKTCNVHDLLRKLCLRVAKKEKFLCLCKFDRRYLHRDFRSGYSNYQSARVICELCELPIHFKLLRVLKMGGEVIANHDVGCLEAKLEQVNLRYLSRKLDICRFPSLSLPSSISRLWNLQTLIIRGDVKITAPSEIWEMSQLRHLEFDLICLPDPPQRDDFPLLNLQTLLNVGNFKLSEEVCKRIPNIKKLEMTYDGEVFNSTCDYFQHNLGRFCNLDSLNCDFHFGQYWREFALSLTFPSSLRKLSLRSSGLGWEDLTMIGSLPNLEVLKLVAEDASLGSEWNPVEGEFLQLKYLKIESFEDLIHWNADSSHFPVLERLALIGLSRLAEVPLDIGEIPTLDYIYLKDCSVSAAVSAMRIQEEQEELGNEGLLLKVDFLHEEDEKIFKNKVKKIV